MSNLPQITFDDIDDTWSGPSDGTGYVNFGFDGCIKVKIIEAKPETQGGKNGRPIVGQIAIKAVVVDEEGSDAYGQPLNGLESRAWLVYAGVSKKGDPLGWQFKNLLVSTGVYSVEALQKAAKKSKAEGNPSLGQDIETLAQQVIGKIAYFSVRSSIEANGKTTSGLENALTKEQYEKKKNTPTEDGGCLARVKQNPYDKRAPEKPAQAANPAFMNTAYTPPPLGGSTPAPAPAPVPVPAAPPPLTE